jgi:hypothetical protein
MGKGSQKKLNASSHFAADLLSFLVAVKTRASQPQRPQRAEQFFALLFFSAPFVLSAAK